MVLAIHHDENLNVPSAPERKVSFQTAAPLTPYNKQKRPSRNNISKQQQTPITKKSETTTTMASHDKENATSTMSSMRRSIRSTMSPTPASTSNHQQQQQSLKPEAAVKTPLQRRKLNVDTSTTTPTLLSNQRTPLSSVLRRSMMGARPNLGPPQRVPTPTSMLLQNEMIFDDPDMSLLISPSAMGNPNDVVSSPDQQQNQQQHAPASRLLAFHSHKLDESTLEEDEQEQQEPVEAFNTNDGDDDDDSKIMIRGNGVQMDLSEMFSGLDSPAKHNNNNTAGAESSMPTVLTNNLRQGIILNFGDDHLNVVGQARSLPFVIEAAPNATADFFLEIEKIPFIKGVNLVVADPSSALLKGLTPAIKSHQKRPKQLGGPSVPNMLNVRQGKKSMLFVTWTPVEVGGVREVILLKLPRGPGRLRVTVLGKAREAKKVRRVDSLLTCLLYFVRSHSCLYTTTLSHLEHSR
jgi:hypothetical protein